MNDNILLLAERLRENMGFYLRPPPPRGESGGDMDAVLGCVTDALDVVSLAGLALLNHRNNFVRPLAKAAAKVMANPSISRHARFQSLLFAAHEDAFSRIFSAKYVTKDVVPLYIRKYMQVLGRLAEAPRPPEQEGKGQDADPVLVEALSEALTFLVNNWKSSLAILRPSSKVPQGPMVEMISGPHPSTAKAKSVSNQIEPGLYFLSESQPPLALHPFFHLDEGRSFAFRMVSPDGLFYQPLNSEGYTLLFVPELLTKMGNCLFRLGAYDKALHLFRLMESENREAFIMVSALNHCLNALSLLEKGRAVQSVQEWELALAVRPDFPVLYHEAAEACLEANRYSQAAAILNRLLERYPVSDEGYVALGDVYTAKGDLGRARRAYEKAVLLNPSHKGAAAKKKQTQRRLELKTGHDKEKAGAIPEEILINLTQQLRQRQRLPLVGRSAQLNQLLEILACKDKHNALLVGDAGVGKTALVEELSTRLLERGAPKSLKGREIISLNLAALISGARYRGQFEERVLEVVKRVKELRPILLIENLHQLMATGSSRGTSLDSASLFKPSLMSGDIQVVGTTSEEAYANILEKDPSFLKLFHLIRLEELSIEKVQEVVGARAPLYEEFHGVHFPDGLVENCVEMARLSISRQALPESILDLMDRTAARVALQASRGERKERTVKRRDLLETLSEMSGVAYERLSLLDQKHLSRMEGLLSELVVGQEDAVRKVSRLIRMAKLGMDLQVNRPDGVFLFVGPTGVGKTELARCIAKLLYGDEEKLIRIDMSEYMERISGSRLIGTAPGYVGYYDQNQLTDQVRKNPYCVVLFDEVEKADPQILNLFLQIFDAGRLTDGKGRTVRFQHATIIMTSNVGTQLYSKARVGYAPGEERVSEEALMREVRAQFSPEFLNRVDEVILFKNLTKASLGCIVDLQLADLVKRLEHQGKRLVLSPEAREALAEEGYSTEYGARNLGRTLRRRVSEPLAQLSLSETWDRSGGARVVLKEGTIAVEPLVVASEISLEQTTEGEDHEKESPET